MVIVQWVLYTCGLYTSDIAWCYVFCDLRMLTSCIVHSTIVIVYLHQNPLDVVKRFLSANTYAEAPNQTLSESDWELRKPTIFLKSVFLHESEEGSITSIMEWVSEYKCHSTFELNTVKVIYIIIYSMHRSSMILCHCVYIRL